MATVFTLLRHGETLANLNHVIQGQTDVPLSPAGEEQARALGRRWRGRRFDAVYASDLSRAMRTAELALPGQPAIPTPELREMDLGSWCGLEFAEIQTRFPEDYAAFRSGDPERRIGGGESRRMLVRRAENFFLGAARRHPGAEVLAVTHAGVVRALFTLVAGWGAAGPAVGNTGICVVSCDPDGPRWRLITWNDTAHLETPVLDGDAY